MRTKVILVCEECLSRNYTTSKNPQKNVERLEIKKFCKKCTQLAHILVVYNILLLIVLPRMGINYATFPYALRDVMFGLLLLSLFSCEFTKRELYTRALIYFIILFVMSERTMALGMLLLLFSFHTISKIKSTKRLKFIFVAFSIVLLILPFIYVEASKTNVADAVDLLFQQYTGKRFFSGREELWDAAIKMIQEKPLFGYGFDDYYFNRGTREMSVHNLYLYILLQGGVVNLSLIMGLFYLIFNRLIKGERDYKKNLSLCLLMVCMLLADFGLILFANNMLYSIFLWTGVAISLVDSTSCESLG